MRFAPAKSRVMMAAAAAAVSAVGWAATAQQSDAAEVRAKTGFHTEAPTASADANAKARTTTRAKAKAKVRAKARAKARAKTRARAGVRTLAPKAKKSVLKGKRAWIITARRPGTVKRIEFRINGKLKYKTKKHPFRYAGKRGSLDTTKMRNGKHRLKATVVRKNGKRTSVVRVVHVRNGHGAAPAPAPAPASAPAPAVPTLPPATRFVAPGGNDAATCGVGAPCASMDRAYQVAAPGEVVEVAGGSYGSQTINASAGKPSDSAPVIIRAAAGQGVSLGYLSISAKRVEVRGITTNGWYIHPGADGVTLRGVVSTSATFIETAHGVSLLGGEIRNVDSKDGLQVKTHAGAEGSPRDLLIDGLYIHDITMNRDPSAHAECIQVMAGRNVTIRNSRFNNCGTQGVFFKEDVGGVIDGVLVENSWFGKLAGYNSLISDRGVTNLVARYNSFSQAPRFGTGGDTGLLTVYGNAGEFSNCGSVAKFHHNVWTGAVCGPGDVRADPGFVNAAGFDLRVGPGSAAVRRGDPSAYPATDIFGTPRAQGGVPTAGAVEVK